MSEFGGEDGPHGLDPRTPGANLPARHKLRLLYAVGRPDPALPRDEKKFVWHGLNEARFKKINADRNST